MADPAPPRPPPPLPYLEGFLRYRFGGLYLEGLIHAGAYLRNFTVFPIIDTVFLQNYTPNSALKTI